VATRKDGLTLFRKPVGKETISLESPESPEPATMPLGDWIGVELAKPATRYLLQDLIMPQGLTVIAGRPKLGKSFLALGSLIAMSANHAVGLLQPEGASASLYLDLEGVARETAARAEGMRLQLGLTRTALNLVHMYCPRKAELLAPGYHAELVDLVRQTGAATVVLDTFATSFTGDENAKKDVQKYLNILKDIRDTTGCAAVLVHHVNKAAFGYKQTAVMMDPDAGLRGSSALQGAYDVIVSLQDGWVEGAYRKVMIVRGKYCGDWWAEFGIEAGASVQVGETSIRRFGLNFSKRRDEYALFETGPSADPANSATGVKSIYRQRDT
jgi:hypothetical protein